MRPVASRIQPDGPCLTTLQADFFEAGAGVARCATPLFGVVRDVQRVVTAPPTTRLAVGMLA